MGQQVVSQEDALVREWGKAAAAGRRRTARAALAIAIAVAVGLGMGVLLVWKFHDETWVHTDTGADASGAVVRGIVMASVVATLATLLVSLRLLRPDLAREYKAKLDRLLGRG